MKGEVTANRDKVRMDKTCLTATVEVAKGRGEIEPYKDYGPSLNHKLCRLEIRGTQYVVICIVDKGS